MKYSDYCVLAEKLKSKYGKEQIKENWEEHLKFSEDILNGKKEWDEVLKNKIDDTLGKVIITKSGTIGLIRGWLPEKDLNGDLTFTKVNVINDKGQVISWLITDCFPYNEATKTLYAKKP